MNVAVTRAWKLCMVICDSDSVSGNDFLKGMVDYFKLHGRVHSVQEYRGVDSIEFGEGDPDAWKKSKWIEAKNESKPKEIKDSKKKKDKPKEKPKGNPSQKTEEVAKDPTADVIWFGLSDSSELENKKKEFKEQFMNLFLEEKAEYQEIEFPNTLNAFERKAIYDICEDLDLEKRKVEKGDVKQLFIFLRDTKIENVKVF